MGELEAGFAKLQGEDFEYYMQTYSIILGRNSKKSTVDVDLASMGGGMNISRQHARIYYDFGRKRFALEVLSKNGCYVEGVLYLRGTSHVKLDSQDLLQIGEKKFYFLLPTKQISIAKPAPPPPLPAMVAPAPIALAAPGGSSGKKRSKQSKAEDGSLRKESKKRKSAGGEAAALSAAAAMQAGLSIASGSSGGNGVYPHSTPPPSGGPAYSSEVAVV